MGLHVYTRLTLYPIIGNVIIQSLTGLDLRAKSKPSFSKAIASKCWPKRLPTTPSTSSSPPRFTPIAGRKPTAAIHPDADVEWFLPRAEQFMRVLKPSGTFILNIKEKVVNGERHPYVLALILALRRQGWLWTEEYIWHKKNCYPGKWHILHRCHQIRAELGQ